MLLLNIKGKEVRYFWLPLFLFSVFNSPVQAGIVKENKDKLDDDPTKVTTKVGLSWANNFELNDGNTTFSGSLALDEVRKVNLHVNSDASEWRVGGSWLFPVGIVNFNFGKNEYINGATQTNYSIGTFIPLSYFGFTPAGFQIFPMAGYTYNTGEVSVCSACNSPGLSSLPSADNGFNTMTVSGGSGYLGAFALKPLSENVRLISFVGSSFGSENRDGENYKGYWG
ncbi:hypothetical protein, partial [Rahnella woolbedingensis]|uniref:hypothetical protein n=1 Tax=Rahnella woolbedingensis TaxID=1510574 RepID=UPI001ABF8822